MSTNDLEPLIAKVGTNPAWFDKQNTIAVVEDQTLPDYAVAEEAFVRMRTLAERDGWKVLFEPMSAGHQGTTDPNNATITLSTSMNPLVRAKVMAHELGHVYGHGRAIMVLGLDFPMPITETIAESVSFLITQAFGWPETASAYMTKGMGPGKMNKLRNLIRQFAPITIRTANLIMREANLTPLLLAA